MVYYEKLYGIQLQTYKALDQFYMFFITILGLMGKFLSGPNML